MASTFAFVSVFGVFESQDDFSLAENCLRSGTQIATLPKTLNGKESGCNFRRNCGGIQAEIMLKSHEPLLFFCKKGAELSVGGFDGRKVERLHGVRVLPGYVLTSLWRRGGGGGGWGRPPVFRPLMPVPGRRQG